MGSPLIVSWQWGKLDVEGYGNLKDAKLTPAGARPWDWAETGTEHQPGIQPADVEELVDAGAAVVVLSRGVHGRLGVMPTTLDHLKDKGIPCEVAATPRAIDRYNALARAGEPVGALIHSTC